MKKLLLLLAIFCIIGSAAVVSAADVNDDQGGYAGINYQDDMGGWAGSNYQDDGGWAGSQYNETNENQTDRPLIDPDYAHMEPGSNSTGNAAGGDVNVTANAATSNAMLTTGNPILLLLAVL